MLTKNSHPCKTALVLLILLTLLTGLVYPLVVTGVARLLFPKQAYGSMIKKNGKIVGSELIGQFFTDPKYFWGRPSATQPLRSRSATLQKADPDNKQVIPIDLVTASASGLDPHISPAAAFYQVSRIAKSRKISEEKVRALIESQIKISTLAAFDIPRVNVLKLNLALDDVVK